ncbi:phage tail sheath family protein [Ramlibacter sp. USB13]|uniref:Phage tail sheath family protein n=1 Tax=Ramlibacter cellulosilyticus TaxID=2764187 RepID=A0A923MR44_9BURK|nr:phage tail sheath family protein [Ramlibacter cellulosilyticus]MBC5783426.1 phage tail sheath family protein [Ramlibacter cellulosilyticus]
MSLQPPRRLPGVRFEVPPPALDEALPRMDIAFFVGFATRGPLVRAVAVESLAEFEAVYGTGIALARDRDTREPVSGLLHPCVRSFFSQGGRRCWILRVAGASVEASMFPVPGMLLATPREGGQGWQFAPASLRAATPGSGADTLRVAARTETLVLRVRPVEGDAEALSLSTTAAAAAQLQAGDLLRVERDGVRLHARVEGIGTSAGLAVVRLRSLCALQPLVQGSPAADDGSSWIDEAGLLHVRDRLAGAMPQLGEVLPLGDPLAPSAWFALTQAEVVETATRDRAALVELQGPAWEEADVAPLVQAWCAAGEERVAQVLRVQLQVREGSAVQALSPVLRSAPGASGLDAVFPLVAPASPDESLWLPLLDLPGFSPFVAPWPRERSALERDGLADFSWHVFAEPALAGYASDVLADRAEALLLAGGEPRPLRGMHALFGGAGAELVDEPTLLAIPDAVHPGWIPAPEVVAWEEGEAFPDPEPPAAGPFADCAAEPLPAPSFERGADPDAAGGFTLYWTDVETGATYVLEEASDPSFAAATILQEALASRYTAVERPGGSYHFRVRAVLGPRRSGWSRPVRITVGETGFVTKPWRSDELLAIHRLMLRSAAGRGDVLAVLALPAHFDRTQAIAHADALREPHPAGGPVHPPALGEDEARALSHGALYHPWLVIVRDREVLRFPPDGAVCGQLAGSALRRGAWIAVANQPLRDVVALLPAALAPDTPQRQALLDAQVNLVRNAPHGIVLSTADTLTPDAPWRPVNVRRLMALLRRSALKRGVTYVFEPNGPALRRTVERAFGAMLDLLFRRGAFAGTRADAAYRVDAGETLNTRQRADAGQFWVELQVAPALPLEFLTVRVVREGDRVASREVH